MNISPANIMLEIASFRGQAISDLISSSANSSTNSQPTDFAQILGMKQSANNESGYNLALKDPQSAFDMMSVINSKEVTFKAQYSELSTMGTSLQHMEDVGNQLNEVSFSTSDTNIKAQLQNFVTQYNTWIDRFASDTKAGGILNNVQAAEISIYELDQRVENRFFGASTGVDGMGDLGITIDPVSKHASLDSAKLESVLATNKEGVVNTIDEFSASFANAADLLNSPGNFIQKQLDNRSRAIQFIDSNRTSLQAEFGTGATASPTGDVAKALAAYQQAFDIV